MCKNLDLDLFHSIWVVGLLLLRSFFLYSFATTLFSYLYVCCVSSDMVPMGSLGSRDSPWKGPWGRNWSFEVSLLIWDSKKKTRFCNDLIDSILFR